MSRLRLSLVITFFSSNGATAVNFVVTIVLARLLSPSEIGIFSITAVITAIAHIFRDFGVGSYLQREKDLTPEKVRAAIGVLLTSSWSIALLLFILSGYAADYYRQPGIQPIMQVLAMGFLFIPFGSVTHALLTREFRAKEQAMVNVAGTTAYATSSIVLALLGFSYMSMAWANLINIIVTSLAYVPFRPKNAPWLPSFRGWRKVVNFGTGAILGNSVGAMNNAMPDMVLGKVSGAHDVGIMSRATSTTNIFTQIAGPTVHYAVLPYLAQKHHDGESLRDPLSQAVSYLTVFAWPAIFVTAVFAQQIVLFLYGEKWLECVPIIRVICLMTALGIPFNFNGAALMAIGRPYLAVMPAAALLLLRIGAIVVLYDGTLVSFAYALVLASLFIYPIQFWLQKRYLDFHIPAFLKAQSKSMGIALACALAAYGIDLALPKMPPGIELAILAAALIPFWILLIIRLKHPMLNELTLLGQRLPLIGKLLRISS
ncbi:MAG: lipopolysaccharide biosynthesis protein [Betaproteobacteria bacterium]